MHGEDRPNIKTQLIIGALKFSEFPNHISIDYGLAKLSANIYSRRFFMLSYNHMFQLSDN